MDKTTRARLQKQAREATAQTAALKPLDMVDNRTAAELKADGDDKWPDGTPYTPPKPAKKPPAAPPAPLTAHDALVIDGTVCCACSALLNGDDLVQQTKRGRWRHVTCPARPAKPQKMKPRFQHGETRLPEGSEFTPPPLWSNGFWTGGLRIGFDGPQFTDKASGVFKLLEKLDLQYRQSLPKPVETAVPIA